MKPVDPNANLKVFHIEFIKSKQAYRIVNNKFITDEEWAMILKGQKYHPFVRLK